MLNSDMNAPIAWQAGCRAELVASDGSNAAAPDPAHINCIDPSLRVWIVMVNYRTPKLAIESLSSIADQMEAHPDCRVLVVDNDSRDGSASIVTEAIFDRGWQRWASVISAERNGGFAFGNNLGMRAMVAAPDKPEYLLLLNPDTVAKPQLLHCLGSFMKTHPVCGIAGCKIDDPAGNATCSAHNFPSPISEFDQGLRLGPVSRWLKNHVVSPPLPSTPQKCDWVSGACMMIRRELIEHIGLMDEGYFLYFEEVDYCRLAQQSGWEVWFCPDASVVHLEGASTGIANQQNRRAAYWYDSRRRYFMRYYGVSGLLMADFLWVVGRCGRALRSFFQRGVGLNDTEPLYYARDLLLGDLKALLGGSPRAALRAPRIGG